MEMSVSATTLKTYTTALKKVSDFTQEQLKDKPDEVIKYVNNLPCSNSYKKVIYNAINYQTGKKDDRYSAEIAKLKAITKEEEKKQELPEERAAKMLAWPEVLALQSKLGELTAENSLIYRLYTLNPPVRADYSRMMVCDTLGSVDDEQNWYVKNLGIFVFNDYKTAKKYGQQIVKVHPQLQTYINQFLDVVKDSPYLLPTITTKASLSKRVISIFDKLCGKEMGIGLLRHSYITEFLKAPKSIKQKEKLSQMMLHSYQMQEQYCMIKDDDDE